MKTNLQREIYINTRPTSFPANLLKTILKDLKTSRKHQKSGKYITLLNKRLKCRDHYPYMFVKMDTSIEQKQNLMKPKIFFSAVCKTV